MNDLIAVQGALRRSDFEAETLTVDFQSATGCRSCTNASVCGPQDSGTSLPRENTRFEATLLEMQPGEKVEVIVSAASLLRISVLCYLLPACLVVLSAWVATILFPGGGDWAALGAVLVGLSSAAYVLSRVNSGAFGGIPSDFRIRVAIDVYNQPVPMGRRAG